MMFEKHITAKGFYLFVKDLLMTLNLPDKNEKSVDEGSEQGEKGESEDKNSDMRYLEIVSQLMEFWVHMVVKSGQTDVRSWVLFFSVSSGLGRLFSRFLRWFRGRRWLFSRSSS